MHVHAHGVPSSATAASDLSQGLGTWLAEWRHWVLMVLVMMLPIVAPYARWIAMRSLWKRRQRAIMWFLVGYLAVWSAIGAALAVVLASVDGIRAWPAIVIGLLGAGVWQVSPPRRRMLRRCGSLPPGAIRGWRADRDCAATGVRTGLRCGFVCGPVMLAMALGQSVILMAGLLVLLLSERARGPNPGRRAGRQLEAWGLVACAAAVAVTAIA